MPGSAYSDPPTFTPLQKLTAALQNALSDAIRALKWWNEAGSIPYAYDNDQLEKLLKPGVDSLLQMGATGVPVWTPKANVGGYHAKATVDVDLLGQAIGGTSTWIDLNGATVNIVTTVACTLHVSGYVGLANGVAGNTIKGRCVVGASGDAGQASETSAPYYTPVPIERYVTGVAAGTTTVKLQAWANGTGGSADNCRINVFAIPE